MKSLSIFFLAVALILGAGPIDSLRAQTDDQAGGGGGGAGARLGFLSAADRMHFLKVRRQVLESNPALKSEQESLTKEREFVKNKGTAATEDDRKTLIQNFVAHSKSMRDAMVAADPTVAPILDQVDAKMKERFKDRMAGAGGAGAGN
jgi:hypothetical protein